MAASVLHQCGCAACRSRQPHPDQRLHRQINLLISRLDEQQRRWFAAVEATRQGHGGVQRLAEITGLDRHTIARGQRELASGLADRTPERIRRRGAGRPARERQDAGLTTALENLLEPETAGDPMGKRTKVKRRSLRQLSEALSAAGHPASRPTVARLLRELGYSPKANTRRGETRSVPERNAQFEHVAPKVELLQELFGLTRAEAEVARALHGGTTKRAVADARSLREATIRTQVRAVLEKTGTVNLRDLERLLANLHEL